MHLIEGVRLLFFLGKVHFIRGVCLFEGGGGAVNRIIRYLKTIIIKKYIYTFLGIRYRIKVMAIRKYFCTDLLIFNWCNGFRINCIIGSIIIIM